MGPVSIRLHLQMKKLKAREVMEPTRGHTAGNWQDKDLNTCPWLLFRALCCAVISVLATEMDK